MEPRNIVIESNIPFIRGVFDDVARVSYLAPEEITAATMRDADALITRTRTRCDASLLKGSKCSIVASATIGLDHIDTEWCRVNGIAVENAPGCNAPAVAQYVMAAIISAYGNNPAGLTLGIIGAGHVGSIVERWARGLGMNVLVNDPPREAAEGKEGFHDLGELAEKADIITVHTPLTRQGPYATYHLMDDTFFSRLCRRPMVINSARGPITDTAALLRALDTGSVSRAVIDCWEKEPDISRELLEKAYIATPHIAGYSREGKIRATAMAAEAVARHLNLPAPELQVHVPGNAPETVTAAQITSTYNPHSDTASLRANSESFETLRNTYPLRHEPHPPAASSAVKTY